MFEPLYYGDKLRIVNPTASIGVVTLWSEIDFVLNRFDLAGIDLNPDSSKIAVVGNLYGRGFRYMLRNLLYNPQIKTLLIFGRDASGSYNYIVNYFDKGLEPVESQIEYSSDAKPVRVIDTDYVMDDLVRPEMFSPIPKIHRIDGIGKESANGAASFIEAYQPPSPVNIDRIAVEVPDVSVTYYPSNLRSHTIVEDHPSDAWRQAVHRIFRFGERVRIKKGERIELQNLKVVIENPHFEDDETIRKCGFDPDEFRKYQTEILSSARSDDTKYSYGHRIRSYFGDDNLEIVARRLIDGHDDRKSFITLWDNEIDIGGKGCPCLVTLFFRKTSAHLHLTATFRTHNAERAYLENIYGLMAIQQFVLERIKDQNIAPGAITVISHSISLNPKSLEIPKIVHDQVARKNVFRRDPNGNFLITTEGDEIVLQHLYGGDVIGEYRGTNPLTLQFQLQRDCAVSDIGHAMYIGQQIERAYRCIQTGTAYHQEP